MPEEVRKKFPSEIATAVIAVRVNTSLKRKVEKIHKTEPSFAKSVCVDALEKAIAKRRSTRRAA
jgi:hypothetical protein